MTARLVLGAGLLVALTTSSASAGTCTRSAAAGFRDCKASCREELQVARDGCLNRDHACVEVCRAGRELCRDASGFDAAIAACNTQRAAAVDDCRAVYPQGPERDTCIDNAQVEAFRCRDQAREDNADELEACQLAFRDCAQACGPAEVPVDAAACRKAAKLAYRRCQATCVEDFQVDKDACRNRDHECVENCRAGREACARPILTTLDGQIAGCNATRDDAIARCQAEHPEGTDRDQCIDEVQVVAFQCRDASREDAKPGLRACRDGFNACVRSCPRTSE